MLGLREWGGGEWEGVGVESVRGWRVGGCWG